MDNTCEIIEEQKDQLLRYTGPIYPEDPYYEPSKWDGERQGRKRFNERLAFSRSVDQSIYDISKWEPCNWSMGIAMDIKDKKEYEKKTSNLSFNTAKDIIETTQILLDEADDLIKTCRDKINKEIERRYPKEWDNEEFDITRLNPIQLHPKDEYDLIERKAYQLCVIIWVRTTLFEIVNRCFSHVRDVDITDLESAMRPVFPQFRGIYINMNEFRSNFMSDRSHTLARVVTMGMVLIKLASMFILATNLKRHTMRRIWVLSSFLFSRKIETWIDSGHTVDLRKFVSDDVSDDSNVYIYPELLDKTSEFRINKKSWLDDARSY